MLIIVNDFLLQPSRKCYTTIKLVGRWHCLRELTTRWNKITTAKGCELQPRIQNRVFLTDSHVDGLGCLLFIRAVFIWQSRHQRQAPTVYSAAYFLWSQSGSSNGVTITNTSIVVQGRFLSLMRLETGGVHGISSRPVWQRLSRLSVSSWYFSLYAVTNCCMLSESGAVDGVLSRHRHAAAGVGFMKSLSGRIPSLPAYLPC